MSTPQRAQQVLPCSARTRCATIDPLLRVALFRNGASAIIVQWMDGAGRFYNEAVEAPLALIVQDPTDGYHVIDLRIIPEGSWLVGSTTQRSALPTVPVADRGEPACLSGRAAA